MNEPIMIDETLFWRIYNQLLDAERLYWETDGVLSKVKLDDEVITAYHEIVNLLNDLQPIVTSLKEEEGLYS
jgi:hypothetical protein